MLMFIVIAYWALMFAFGYLVVRWILRARIERRNKAFANLPKEALMVYVRFNPVYNSIYQNLRLVMDDNIAAEHAINRMLIDMGLIGYRKG